MQDASRSAYSAVLDGLAADIDPIVDVVVADVRRPDDDLASLEPLVRDAVLGLLERLRSGPELVDDQRSRLRSAGAIAARRGEPVAAPIDRSLSAGWAVWEAATRRHIATPETLASLGSVLLRLGDASAAAIAEGHGEAERELATRAAAARRTFVDDLLDLTPADQEGLARLTRQARSLGLPPGSPLRPMVAWLGTDLDDAGPEAERVSRMLARPSRGTSRAAFVPIVAARGGRLAVIELADLADRPDAVAALSSLAGSSGWVAARGPQADGLVELAGALSDAASALGVAERLGIRDRVVDAEDVAVERLLLLDEGLLATVVDRELGPIARAPRNGQVLLATLATYLDQGHNVRATARALRVAPRTVAYRLERIERLLGYRLEGPALRRLALASLGRDMLATTQPRSDVAVDDRAAGPARPGPADLPRRPDRGRRRPGGRR